MRFSLLWFSVTVVACGPSTPRELWQPAGPGETVMYTLSYLGVVVGRGDVSVTAAGSNPYRSPAPKKGGDVEASGEKDRAVP